MEIKNKIALCRGRLVLILLLNFSDWLCTLTLLNHKGFYEVNPLMVSMLDKPFLCFGVKCVLPLLLIAYIYYILPRCNFSLVKKVDITMLLLGIFYLFINIVHIFNFIFLFITR